MVNHRHLIIFLKFNTLDLTLRNEIQMHLEVHVHGTLSYTNAAQPKFLCTKMK